MQGDRVDMMIADEPIPIDTTAGKPGPKVKRVRVMRESGVCPLCHVPGELIFAYDESIYEGGRCGECLLHRTAEITSHPIDSKIMRPIAITARGTLGEEPFASMLRAADEQNPDLLEESLKKLGEELDGKKRELAGLEREKELEENQSLLRRQGLLLKQVKPNRAARRRAEAIERKKARRARKAAKRKSRGNGAPKKRRR